MKRTILILAAVGLLVATPSCKKGENDPFLSLSSRKARISGTWELSGYEASTKNTEENGDYQSSSSTLSGNVITTSYVDYDAGSQTSNNSSSSITVDKAEYIINKDGTWSSQFDYTAVNSYDYQDFWGDDHTVTVTTVYKSSETGNWSFLGNVKEGEVTYKNKERVILNTLTSTGTSSETEVDENVTQSTSNTTDNGTDGWTDNYYSGEVSMTYEIDQLKSKEMIWKTMEDYSGTTSFTIGAVTNTDVNDMYEASTTLTFSIVK